MCRLSALFRIHLDDRHFFLFVYDRRHNRGVWSEREHGLFLEGFELYGRHWGNITALVETRTCEQVRSHTQKYFKKLKRDSACAEESISVVLTDIDSDFDRLGLDVEFLKKCGSFATDVDSESVLDPVVWFQLPSQ